VRPTAVVVDDDAMARELLRNLIEGADLVDLVGEAADGVTAVRLIDRVHPDIAFLDIEMPGMSGIEVLRTVRHAPVVIFTTGHDEYAVQAFELAAVDYLTKPLGPERLRRALGRAVQVATTEGAEETPTPEERIEEEAEEGGRPRAAEAVVSEGPLTRLFLRDRRTIIPVPVESILRFEAEGDYVMVHTSEHRHLIRFRMRDLEDRLTDRFLRVHRSHLVNLDHVQCFERHEDGRLIVVMSEGTRIIASRARSRELLKLAR